ncbi:hypothetical protein GFH48_12770 [Streptomyces fagopyri]|uniref:Uncharacterized protein n=1 Tax=Streptomyces fagopyri TaxID=2662397 RepID=A0A5Q0LAA0_9ACTN|nr:hypothetical protein [Streptomyces fagopyri]QFZ74002.1 hypothetical protein GFH48_12770 [Streptomyces fagopyri]
MNVDDVIAEQIERARQRIERERRQRAELALARRAGLARRHAQKLRNLALSPLSNGSLAASGA